MAFVKSERIIVHFLSIAVVSYGMLLYGYILCSTGFYGSGETYYTHLAGKAAKGYDFRDQTDVDYTADGSYSMYLFAQRAIDIVSQHDATQPMFMYLSIQNPHTPLEVPSSYEAAYDGVITSANRKTYAGMVSCMDEAIGNVTAAFQQYGLWDNTVLIFSTDNGGLESKGGADNYPLRGGKGNLWEGGIRGVGFVRSNKLTGGVESTELMHVSDWFPTIINLAGGDYSGVLPLDGYDQWDTLSGVSSSPRNELLHNIDPLFDASGTSAYNSSYFDTSCRAAIRKGDWKLLTGNPERKTYSQNVWLFNIASDPGEETDLSSNPAYESIILELLERLAYYNSNSVEPYFPAEDPMSLPWRNANVWGPWL